jgi:hypothetical protein
MEFLKSIQVYDQDAILERIEAFQDPAFIRNLENFDFSADFMQGSQG